MQPEAEHTSTAQKVFAFIGAFFAFPALGLLCVFAERRHFISLSNTLYGIVFIALPFIVFLLLAERFYFFPAQPVLQHITCTLFAAFTSALCFYISFLAAMIIFGAAASL